MACSHEEQGSQQEAIAVNPQKLEHHDPHTLRGSLEGIPSLIVLKPCSSFMEFTVLQGRQGPSLQLPSSVSWPPPVSHTPSCPEVYVIFASCLHPSLALEAACAALCFLWRAVVRVRQSMQTDSTCSRQHSLPEGRRQSCLFPQMLCS